MLNRKVFMSYYIGIDLGTSAMKCLLVDSTGKVCKEASREYPLSFPKPTWSEQSPEDWWKACKECVAELISGIDGSEVKAIGCAGQMHGLVALDAEDKVIRPAILWNDARTAAEVDYLNNEIGKPELADASGNIAFAGFTAPKLLWMRNNEPEAFARIKRIMLPKDYINFLLTGVHATEFSDAAGMLLVDVKNKCWSKKLIDICGIKEEQLPKLFPNSACVVGTLTEAAAQQLGLSASVKVVAGAGDNAAAAVAMNVVKEGTCNISLGTSGTVLIPTESFCMDPNNALHSFGSADGNYLLLACILSAASCNKWLCDEILKTKDYAQEQVNITDEKLGNNSVYFLPYLMGERSPINDTNARAAFIGMSMDTPREALVQAVLEGVAFAVRDNFEVARSLGINLSSSMICGGGAQSNLWVKIIANVLNMPIRLPFVKEGPGYGGALLAMVGAGEYESIQACLDGLFGAQEQEFYANGNNMIMPTKELAARYEKRYQQYKQLYPALKSFFNNI